MQCPNCQNTIPDTANVCGYCGTRLRQPVPPVAPIQPPPQPPSQPIAAPPPSPVAPTFMRRTIPVWAWMIGIFLCLGITLVLIWAVFFSNININLGSSTPPSQAPTLAVQPAPPNTAVPSMPTASPVPPSKTSAPPKPTSVTLPNGISTFLLRAKMLAHDPFSTRDPAWETSENGLTWKNGKLEVRGADGFATGFSRGTLEKGQAVLFLMEYTTADMNLNFLIEKGEWQTSNYYRYGVNLKQEAKTDIWKGTNYLGDAKFIGNLSFEVSRNYYFLLALDSEQEFAAVFWEEGNPHNYTMIRQGRVKDWPDSGWIIVVQANAGMIIFDEFFLLQFEEFAF